MFVVHVYVSTVSMMPNVRRVSSWGYDYYRVCPEIMAQSQRAQNSDATVLKNGQKHSRSWISVATVAICV